MIALPQMRGFIAPAAGGGSPPSGDSWNPADLGKSSATYPALSNSDLTLTAPVSGNGAARTILSHSSGKFYFECSIDTRGASANDPQFGILGGSYNLNTFAGNHGPFGIGDDRGSVVDSPPTRYFLYEPGNIVQFVTATIVSGDVFGYAIDFTLGRMWVHRNGTYSAGNPSTNTSPPLTGISGTFFAYTTVSDGAVITARFTRAAMGYTVPTGFLAWDGT